jgi:hypothetical protein
MGAIHQASRIGETPVAEVSNQRIIERYKDLLANRTHDVIIRDAAVEVLEAEVKRLTDEVESLRSDAATFQDHFNRARDTIARLENGGEHEESPRVIPGTVLGE